MTEIMFRKYAQMKGVYFVFYDKFIALCNEHGESPTSAAVNMGLHQTTVCRWKRGSTPSTKTMTKVAKYFNCSILDLQETDEAVMCKDDLARISAAIRADAELYELFEILTSAPKDKVKSAIAVIKPLLS